MGIPKHFSKDESIISPQIYQQNKYLSLIIYQKNAIQPILI